MIFFNKMPCCTPPNIAYFPSPGPMGATGPAGVLTNTDLNGATSGSILYYDSDAIWRWTGDVNVRIGQKAGLSNPGLNSISIGNEAGQYSNGDNNVTIGYRANQNSADNPPVSNSIVINASGQELNSSGSSSLTIKPIRNIPAVIGDFKPLYYSFSTGEVVQIG